VGRAASADRTAASWFPAGLHYNRCTTRQLTPPALIYDESILAASTPFAFLIMVLQHSISSVPPMARASQLPRPLWLHSEGSVVLEMYERHAPTSPTVRCIRRISRREGELELNHHLRSVVRTSSPVKTDISKHRARGVTRALGICNNSNVTPRVIAWGAPQGKSQCRRQKPVFAVREALLAWPLGPVHSIFSRHAFCFAFALYPLLFLICSRMLRFERDGSRVGRLSQGIAGGAFMSFFFSFFLFISLAVFALHGSLCMLMVSDGNRAHEFPKLGSWSSQPTTFTHVFRSPAAVLGSGHGPVCESVYGWHLGSWLRRLLGPTGIYVRGEVTLRLACIPQDVATEDKHWVVGCVHHGPYHDGSAGACPAYLGGWGCVTWARAWILVLLTGAGVGGGSGR